MKMRTPLTLAAGLALGLALAGPWAFAQPDRDGPPRHDEGHHDDDPRRERRDMMRDRFDGAQERWGEHLDEVIAVVREIDPQVAERIENAKEDRPGAKLMMIRRSFPQVFDLVKLREDDPAMYELRVEDVRMHKQAGQLARQYHQAKRDEDDRAADDFEDELEELVEAHFDVRQEIRELELERLEQRVEALKEALDDRKRDKNDLIDDRLEKMLRRDTESRF